MQLNSFAILSVLLYFAIQTHSSRLLTADYVTKSGKVILHNDYHGIYVDVDFSYNYNDASDSDGSDTSIARMALALYTSQTVLGMSCLTYSNYSCSSNQCTPYPDQTATPYYLDFFVSSGYYASVNIFLDYENWQLNDFAVIATSCNSDHMPKSVYGHPKYGLIGLGVNNTYPNFMSSSPKFSIYLSPKTLTGTLTFGSNSDIEPSSTYVGTLSANSEWQIPVSSVIISVKGQDDNAISATVGALFDLNFAGVGIPKAIFDNITQYLEDTLEVFCTGSVSITCSHNGKLGELPTITMNIWDVNIDIPPSLYAQSRQSSNEFTITLTQLDPSLSGGCHVTQKYQDYIVFGQTFMSYYYTEFDYNDGLPTISLYIPYSTNVVWPYILGGVLGLIIIAGIIFLYIRKRKARRIQQQGDSQLTVDTVNSASLLSSSNQQE